MPRHPLLVNEHYPGWEMANIMFHDQAAKPITALNTLVLEKAELDRLIAEAYAKGRTEAFTFLGLDEKDFPEGDGLTGWVA